MSAAPDLSVTLDERIADHEAEVRALLAAAPEPPSPPTSTDEAHLPFTQFRNWSDSASRDHLPEDQPIFRQEAVSQPKG